MFKEINKYFKNSSRISILGFELKDYLGELKNSKVFRNSKIELIDFRLSATTDVYFYRILISIPSTGFTRNKIKISIRFSDIFRFFNIYTKIKYEDETFKNTSTI